MSTALNKCASCGTRALLVRRRSRLDYRCPNRACAERPRTRLHDDTPFDLDVARVEWNDINPAITGIRWRDTLERKLGRRVSAIIRGATITTTVTGELGFHAANYRVATAGAIIEFPAAAVQTIDDDRIYLREHVQRARSGLTN